MILLVLFIFGCAAAPPKPAPPPAPVPAPTPVPAPGKDHYSQFPDRYRNQAMEYEKSDELPRALQCWEIVLAFRPDDEEGTQKIAALRKQMQTLADEYFKKGLGYYQSHSIPAARKAFLLTLYYNPDQAEALSYLKDRLTEEDHTLYEVKPGDTLKEIAKKVYNDPQKDFLIAHFNDLEKDPKLTPKTTVRLPILDVPESKATMETKETPMAPKEILVEPKEKKETMAKAQAYFKANKFKETVSITEEILVTDPSNKEARDLTNGSYYQMGKALNQQKKYEEALEQFARVDPGYRDVTGLISSLKKQVAEVHYVNGIKYFTEEKLDKAIQEWEETLKYNPQHRKAKEDMESAAKLLEKLKEIK